MRFSAIIPILLSSVAFILSILVILAGRNTDFLTDVYIIKLDTSNIGNGYIDVPNTGVAAIDNAIDSIPGSVISDIVQSAAKALGLHDFYTAQVMGYCEGMFNAAVNGKKPQDTVTNCTSKPMFTFDPVVILQNELKLAGGIITLEDIGFPTQSVGNAVRALNAAYKAMFIAYCVGISAAGICFVLGFAGFFMSRLAACVNWLFAFLSFFALGLASGVGTVIAVKLRDIINSNLVSVGITASYSSKYLGMTWAAVVAMLIVSLFWCGACCSGRKDKKQTNTKRDLMADEAPIVEEAPVVDEAPIYDETSIVGGAPIVDEKSAEWRSERFE